MTVLSDNTINRNREVIMRKIRLPGMAFVAVFLSIFFFSSGAEAQPKSRRVAVPISGTNAPQTMGTWVPASDLSALEKAVVDELNLARTNPASYAKILVEMRSHFNGTTLRLLNQPPIVTAEGAPAFDEAIAFLKSVAALPKLYTSRGLTLAARDHLADLLKTGKSGHVGSDKSSPDDRIRRRVNLFGDTAEIIKYYTRLPREIAVGIIVDDGNPNRGHRKTLFSSGFLQLGIASGESSGFGQMTVITFANNFIDKK
jgi:uncharacterized protein YkwD